MSGKGNILEAKKVMKVLLITTCVVLLQQDLEGNLYLHVNRIRQRKNVEINDCCVLLKNEGKNMINPKEVERENNFPEYVDVRGQQAWGAIFMGM